MTLCAARRFPIGGRHRNGFRARAALERDVLPTIRERSPRRLPVSGGSKTAGTKQTRGEAFHTSRTGIAQLPSMGVLRPVGDLPPRVHLHMLPRRAGCRAE